MKNSRRPAAAKSTPSASSSVRQMIVPVPAVVPAVALDASLISIKIVDTRSEEDARSRSPHDEALPRSQQHLHRQPQQMSPTLRFLIALAPNTIFACVSGALGLAGACAVTLLALVVLATACVVQFFQGMGLMLVETDRALLQFTTGAVSSSRPSIRLSAGSKQQSNKKTKTTRVGNPGSDLARMALSLLSLSCELLAIGFFKGTLGLSYCSSLYGALVIPLLVWNAGASTATALYAHSFDQAPMAFALLHGGLWVFALLWLGVTRSMSQFCSRNLRTPRQ